MSSGLRRFARRLASLFRSSRAEADLAREIQAHLQLIEDQHVAKGMSREEARFAARRAFGGVEQAKESQRDARSFRWLAGWPMDLKLGVRMLVKSPGLTVIAVLALAIAIGAGAAYREFTVDLLDPELRVPHAERLVGVQVWDIERAAPQEQAIADFAVWRANTRTIEAFGAAVPFTRPMVTSDGRTDGVRGAHITASAFELVPAAPLVGRVLRAEDERAEAPPVAVIGEEIWRQRFDRSPGALGQPVRIGAITYEIVGVMPASFGFPVSQNLWTALKPESALAGRGEGPAVRLFGRLKSGVSADAAQAELTAMMPGEAKVRASVQPYLDSVLGGGSRTEARIVHAANIIFILLLGICGANVATLVFARTAMREAEITVRTALGASRGRISAQLFAEALVLSVTAAAAGLFAARFVGDWAKGLFAQSLSAAPFWWDDGLTAGTIVYAAALAVFAAVIVGVIPAMKATGAQLQGRLRDAASGTSTLKFGGVWTAVIVTQAALTVIAVSAVVALAWALTMTTAGDDVSYDGARLLTAALDLEGEADSAARTAHYKLLRERLQAEPDIAAVTFTTALPGTIWEQFTYELQDPQLQAEADARKATEVLWSEGARVGTGFFETVGLPLVAGRTFTESEVLQGAPVAIVDETFAREVLGGRHPLGVRLRERARDAGQAPGPWLEIVGVVRAAYPMVRYGPDDAAVYQPIRAGDRVRLLARTNVPSSQVLQRVQFTALSVNPDLRLSGLRSVAQVRQDEDLPGRVFLRAFSVISAIALLLATAGIYSLISFTLTKRTREIGIRVALGAARGAILRGVFSRAFIQLGTGVLAGAVPALVIMTSIGGDAGAMTVPGSIAATLAVCVFVMLVAIISCAGPLRRALNVDPIKALRTDA